MARKPQPDESTSPRRTSPTRPDGTWFAGTLEPHQREGVAWLLERPNAVLADDVGLGKTIQALALIGRLEEAGEMARRTSASVCRVLWVTDASLLEQTKSEVERFLPDFTVLTNLDSEFRGTQKARGEWTDRFGAGPDILVLSYEMATSRRHWLSHTTPALVVLDEAMKIKGAGAHFNAVHDLTSRADRVLAMTATPLENNPMELYWLLKAAGVSDLWSEGVFKREFVTWKTVDLGYGRTEQRPVGWRHDRLPEVQALLPDVLLQRFAEDLGLKLPERTGETHRWVQLSLAQRKAYDQAAKKIGRGALVAMEQAAKATGIDSTLVDALMEELDALGDEQAIVYCELLGVLDLVDRRLCERGTSFVRIEGKIKDAERALAVEAFRTGDAQILLGSRVLERGLNLQHCRVLISLDASWNPARERQREGRVRRIGSPHAAFQHLTLLPDTSLTRSKVAQLTSKSATAAAII